MSKDDRYNTSSATHVWLAPDALLHACLENNLSQLATLDAKRVNAPLIDGLLPLQIAATAGHGDAVRALAGRGAHVDATDNAADGQNTALHFAVLARRTCSVQALLDLGANPNAVNCVDTTPMHDAARVGDVRIADALKNSGADLLRVNGYGNNILQRACLYGNHDLLLWAMRTAPQARRRALLSHRNQAGYNVQDIAISRRSHTLTHLLHALGAQASHPRARLVTQPYTEQRAWQLSLTTIAPTKLAPGTTPLT